MKEMIYGIDDEEPLTYAVHMMTDHGIDEASIGFDPEMEHAELHDEDPDLGHARDDLSTPVLRAATQVQAHAPDDDRLDYSEWAKAFFDARPGVDIDVYVVGMSAAAPACMALGAGNDVLKEMANGFTVGFLAGAYFAESEHLDRMAT